MSAPFETGTAYPKDPMKLDVSLARDVFCSWIVVESPRGTHDVYVVDYAMGGDDDRTVIVIGDRPFCCAVSHLRVDGDPDDVVLDDATLARRAVQLAIERARAPHPPEELAVTTAMLSPVRKPMNGTVLDLTAEELGEIIGWAWTAGLMEVVGYRGHHVRERTLEELAWATLETVPGFATREAPRSNLLLKGLRRTLDQAHRDGILQFPGRCRGSSGKDGGEHGDA